MGTLRGRHARRRDWLSFLAPRDRSSGRHRAHGLRHTGESLDGEPATDGLVSESVDRSLEMIAPPATARPTPRAEEPSEKEVIPRVEEALAIEVVVDDRDASELDIVEAESYLVRQVLAMLGVDGEAGDESLRTVADDGMVMITIEDGEPSAAETLERFLEFDAPFRSGALDRGLRGLLNGRLSTWQLHRWLEDRFFAVLAADWNGNPPVWHLSTSGGAFQVLILADGLDSDRLRGLLHRVLKTIDRLTIALQEAGGADDWGQVEAIEARFAEVRSFNDLIFDLLQRRWQVGGELDRAAKLAVMAELGFVSASGVIAQKDPRAEAVATGTSV